MSSGVDTAQTLPLDPPVPAQSAASKKPEGGRSRLLTLEATRFFSASAVMFFHYTSVVYDFTGTRPFNDFFRMAVLPFFFVLSGFIIYHIHRFEIGRPETIKRFLMKRAIRIYPVFLMVSLLMLVGFLIKPTLLGERVLTVPGVLADLMLLPRSDAILSISWTLRHEMIFYGLFTFALYFGARALWLVVLWAAVSMALSGTPLGVDAGGGSVIASVLNIGFVLGIGAAMAFHRWPTQRGIIWALAGGTVIILLCVLQTWLGRGVSHEVTILGRGGDIVFLCASAVMLYGLVNLENSWSMPLPGMWKILGGSTYLLYLLHQPLASVAVRLPKVAHAFPPDILFIVLASFSLLVAILVHLTVERGVLRRLSQLVPPAPKRVIQAS